MGKPKHPKPSKISSGQMAKIHVGQEEKRQARLAQRPKYEYKSIEEATGAKKFTYKWYKEKKARAKKAVSPRSEFTRWRSFYAAQDDRLRKEAEEKAKNKKKIS